MRPEVAFPQRTGRKWGAGIGSWVGGSSQLEEGASGGRVLRPGGIQRPPPPPRRRPQSCAKPPRHIRRPQGARPAGPRYIRAGLLYKAGLVGRGAAGPGPGEGPPSPTSSSPSRRASSVPQSLGSLSGLGWRVLEKRRGQGGGWEEGERRRQRFWEPET